MFIWTENDGMVTPEQGLWVPGDFDLQGSTSIAWTLKRRAKTSDDALSRAMRQNSQAAPEY